MSYYCSPVEQIPRSSDIPYYEFQTDPNICRISVTNPQPAYLNRVVCNTPSHQNYGLCGLPAEDNRLRDSVVLVTGASGYIASHITQLLLRNGIRVRGSVRSLTNEYKIKPLREISAGAKHPLELVVADLNQPESWLGAVSGCTYVIHVASPFPAAAPKHEDDLIRPAVGGTLAILEACRIHRVKRVVITSSIAAIFGDLSVNSARPLTEEDWSDANVAKDAYVKSKTLAESAAWNFMENLPTDERFELAVLNPTYVFGPILGRGDGTTALIVKRLINHEMPLVPKFNFSCVDVRDVAVAHVRALTVPEAAGHRTIIHSGHNLWMQDMANLLEQEFEPQGYSVPTRNAPYALLKISSLCDPALRRALPLYDVVQNVDNSRMISTLGIAPIDVRRSIIDMAYSLIEKGVVKKTRRYRGRPNYSDSS